MILRRDHAAGGAVIAAGVLVLLISNDLPFGTLASPGAGMLPSLVIALMMLFGVALIVRAGESPPIADVSWRDLPHAAKVTGVAAVAASLYTTLGFILTMMLLLFVLIFVVERRPLFASLAISILVPVATYTAFEYMLKTPLERGLFWF
jgi:putative tricarboxylic transport membrane protein